MGTDGVAEWLGVPRDLLIKWRERYDTFPAPDYIITSRKGDIPGWRPNRKTEILTWPRPAGQGWRKGLKNAPTASTSAAG